MTLGSLFDGISGFPLAASWAGIETKWISEIDPYCLKISKKNFPNAIQYGDIKEIGKGRKWEPEAVDIISGGFPCQPFSDAGLKKGKSDNRYLWPEMLRIIRELKPCWVVGENVPGIINLALDDVLTDLENKGYKTETFIIPACAVGAWHKRNRVWIVANNSKLCIKQRGFNKTGSWVREEYPSCTPDASYANKFNGDNRGFNSGKVPQLQESEIFRRESWGETESEFYRIPYGIPPELDKYRNPRIEALGNAIVPQVAYEIFKAIIEIENNL